MASGRLGSADLTAATNTTIYTIPAGKVASFSVCFCNRTTANINVRLAMATSGTPSNAEWVEYGAPVSPGGVLERTGLVADANKQIVAYAVSAGVSVNVYGFEE